MHVVEGFPAVEVLYEHPAWSVFALDSMQGSRTILGYRNNQDGLRSVAAVGRPLRASHRSKGVPSPAGRDYLASIPRQLTIRKQLSVCVITSKDGKKPCRRIVIRFWSAAGSDTARRDTKRRWARSGDAAAAHQGYDAQDTGSMPGHAHICRSGQTSRSAVLRGRSLRAGRARPIGCCTSTSAS